MPSATIRSGASVSSRLRAFRAMRTARSNAICSNAPSMRRPGKKNEQIVSALGGKMRRSGASAPFPAAPHRPRVLLVLRSRSVMYIPLGYTSRVHDDAFNSFHQQSQPGGPLAQAGRISRRRTPGRDHQDRTEPDHQPRGKALGRLVRGWAARIEGFHDETNAAEGRRPRAPLMLRYMLDTNICIHVAKNYPPKLRERFNRLAEQLCISSVTLAELCYGAEKSEIGRASCRERV